MKMYQWFIHILLVNMYSASMCMYVHVHVDVLFIIQVGVINDTAFSIAFKEWKFCRHELDVLQSKDFMECPTCAVFQHSAHVDGNAKLYRYKSAGR